VFVVRVRAQHQQLLEEIMKKLVFVIAASALSAGVACAQTPAAQTVQPSAVSKVENWTNEQWKAAKAEWVKDRTKWSDCQQHAAEQKLTGRKSWSFLYTCMTTRSL
jgi:uncharacterized lipoprotein YajG